MGVPKLLFHGTAALSVWKSYRKGQALRQLSQNDPRRLEKVLKGAKKRDYYARFGPLYPDFGYYKNWWRLCLTNSLRSAWGYARSWRSHPAPVEGRSIKFENSRLRNLNMSAEQDAAGPLTQEVAELIRRLSFVKPPFFTPGAILLVDGPYLEDRGLLRLSGWEEYANCLLPWEAIRGVLMVDVPPKPKIASFLVKDRSVLRDFYPEDLFPHREDINYCQDVSFEDFSASFQKALLV